MPLDERPTSPAPSFVIDCGECVRFDTDTCEQCVVTFICSRQPDEAIVVDVAEVRALRALHIGGLVPPLLHERRSGRAG